MRKFPPPQLTASKDRSIHNRQQHRPHILPRAATHIQSLSLCVSLSPSFYSHADKGNTKAPAVHSLRHRPTSVCQTLSLALQLSRFPSGECIDPKPERISAAEIPSQKPKPSQKLSEQQSDYHERMPSSISRFPTRVKESGRAGFPEAMSSRSLCLSFANA